jgi:chitinase
LITDDQVVPGAGYEPTAPALGEPPRRQLSVFRVLVLLMTLAALGAGAYLLITKRASQAALAGTPAPAFAPYVDVTLTPTYAFESPAADPVSGAFLSFVVAEPSRPCTPSWGGFYTLPAAESALNLDERIAQVRAQGGNPMISFGGRSNSELAVSCRSVPALTTAYLAPVRRYRTKVIDLDIEGSSLADHAAAVRRGLAIAAAQRAQAARGASLGVWLTLPVAPTGLTDDGVYAITAMLRAHVKLAGVNALAMDFGATVGAHTDMIVPVEASLNASAGQLQTIYQSAGLRGEASAVWRHLGATVMIGQNDVAGERFTIADAGRLAAFAGAHHLARVSTWSLNRDSECGSVFAQVGVLSNQCSGVRQTPLQFTRILSRLPGTETARSAEVGQSVPQVQSAAVDNPARSPYPIWQPTAMYVAGYKVVWHHNVFEAKWFSQGTAPDAPTPDGAPSGWLLIGPVAPAARAPKPVLFDSASHPQWGLTTAYHLGARVRFEGLPYQARWYTRGDQPEATLPADSNSPWQPLYTVSGEPPAASAGAKGAG